ncbi:MAG TPA: thioredoxin domain-containing protein [Nitrospira sp.]
MSSCLQPVIDADFDRVVERATVPVLIEFWKPGCGHCKSLMKELEQLQDELGEKVLVLTMNADENFQIPSELEISALPALVLYRNGSFERFIGGLGKKDEIRKQLGL